MLPFNSQHSLVFCIIYRGNPKEYVTNESANKLLYNIYYIIYTADGCKQFIYIVPVVAVKISQRRLF